MRNLIESFLRVGQRTVAVAVAGLTVGAAWATQGRSLEVVVTYQGGEVSSTNVIYVTVYDTSNMQGAAQPIAWQVVTENSETASFSNLTASPVYVAELYDEGGNWDWQFGVPSGSPAGRIEDASFAPVAIELTAGEAVTVELTFNDAFRMP